MIHLPACAFAMLLLWQIKHAMFRLLILLIHLLIAALNAEQQ
jgi:hypothetical protein